MHSNNKDGRINFIICLNLSFVEAAALPIEASTLTVEGTFFSPRLGSLTVNKIIKPMTIPGIPAMMKDLEINLMFSNSNVVNLIKWHYQRHPWLLILASVIKFPRA
jgi:hypothetical protein